MTTIEHPSDNRVGRASKGRLLAPVVGIVAAAGVMGTGAGFSVTDDLPVEAMLEKLENARAALLIGGAVQALAAMGLVIFGAWLFARLRAVEPPGALTAAVAAGGCGLTAAMMAMAAAHTQLATYDGEAVADTAVPLTLHTLEEHLFAGAWCSVALIAGAVAVASLRHRVLPSWFGGVSAFIAVLLVVLQVVVPWAGWFPAMIWFVVAGFGLRSQQRTTSGARDTDAVSVAGIRVAPGGVGVAVGAVALVRMALSIDFGSHADVDTFFWYVELAAAFTARPAGVGWCGDRPPTRPGGCCRRRRSRFR